jgi:hypothetical protein
MENKNPLPSREELKRFIESLTPPNEEMDEVSATIVLEQAGVDVGAFPDDLMTRLDREVEEMRAREEEVPAPLLEFTEALHRQVEAEKEEPSTDPETHIKNLLAKKVPPRDEASLRASFRSLRVDLLTEEDVRLLEDLYEELKSRKE